MPIVMGVSLDTSIDHLNGSITDLAGNDADIGTFSIPSLNQVKIQTSLF